MVKYFTTLCCCRIAGQRISGDFVDENPYFINKMSIVPPYIHHTHKLSLIYQQGIHKMPLDQQIIYISSTEDQNFPHINNQPTSDQLSFGRREVSVATKEQHISHKRPTSMFNPLPINSMLMWIKS